jgi:hypothetical protein
VLAALTICPALAPPKEVLMNHSQHGVSAPTPGRRPGSAGRQRRPDHGPPCATLPRSRTAPLALLLPLASPLLLLGCDRPFDYQPPGSGRATAAAPGNARTATAAAGATAAGGSCYPADLEKRLAALEAPSAASINGGADGLPFMGDPQRGGGSAAAPAGKPGPLPAGDAGLHEAVRRVRSVIRVDARVFATSQVENAAATAGRVMYNPHFFRQIRRHGGDSAVVGILAHEFGHIAKGHVYRNPRNLRQSQRGELEADAEAGCALAKLKMDSRGYVRVTHALGGGGSMTHPDGERRAEAIQGGYARCQGQNAPLVAEAPRSRGGRFGRPGRGGGDDEFELPGQGGGGGPADAEIEGDGGDDGEGGGMGGMGGPIVRRGRDGSIEIEIPSLADLGQLGGLTGGGGGGMPGLEQGEDGQEEMIEQPRPRRRRGHGRSGRMGRHRGGDDGQVAQGPRRRHRERPPVDDGDGAGGGGLGGLDGLGGLGGLGLDNLGGFEVELPDGRSFPRLAQLASRLGHLFDFLDFEPPWGYLPSDRRPR